MGTLRRVERWWWTGPIGHAVGGLLDLAQAWVRYLTLRRRRRP
jgi:hypothetical protein